MSTTPTEFGTQMESLIETEVERRVSDIKEALSFTRSTLTKTQKELDKMIQLNQRALELEEQASVLDFFRSVFKEENLENLLGCFSFTDSGIPFTGMCIKDAPRWFKIIIEYYEDREKLFPFFDFFDIKYPKWARNFRMPFDYTKEEVMLILENFNNLSISNGCYFDQNMGFFWESISSSQGDPEKMMQGRWRNAIPLQHLFKNPNIVDPECWELVVEYMKSHDDYNKNKLFYISKYQEISKEQAAQLFQFLPAPKRMSDVHGEFVKRHATLLSEYPQYARMFMDEITTKSGTLNYLNFPVVMQLEFIDKPQFDFTAKVGLIKQMPISREEKLKLINKYVHIAV